MFGVGEHHRPEYAVSAPAVVLAAAAARTERIRLTSAVTVLSSAVPVRAVSAVRDARSPVGGRAEMMVGRGSFIESFPLFGFDLRDYDTLFEEKLLRACSTSARRGSHRPGTACTRDPHGPIPIWVAVGGTPESAVRAGMLGLPMALAIIGGQPERFRPFAELHRRGAAGGGHRTAVPEHQLARLHRGDAERAIDESFPYVAEAMNRIGRERGWPPMTRADYEAAAGPRGANFVGTPEQVVEKILYQREVFGHDRFLLQFGVGGVPHEGVLRSIELLGREVAPAVREKLANRARPSRHNETSVSQVIDSLDEARAAAERQAWRAAYAAFGDVDAAELDGRRSRELRRGGVVEREDRGGDPAPGAGFCRVHVHGDTLGAARMALTLAWDYEARGAFAVAGGWIASAERLLAGLPAAPEHGRLLLTHAITALFAEGDLERAVELFDDAYELATAGRRSRRARCSRFPGKGGAYIKAGRIDKGLALLDEASASAMCGDLSAHSAGLVYCITISSCQDVGDYRRAAEWTEAANRWCDTLDLTGFPGACRIHRAEAMRLRGDWSAAEAQALAATEELKDFHQVITAAGHYEIGEIRRRRGDLTGAEDAYRVSNELGREPQPGLSLVRLAEGKVDAAVAGIGRSLQEAAEPLSGSAGFPRRSRSRLRPAISRRRARRGRGRADRRLVQDRRTQGRRIRRNRSLRARARSCSPRRTGTARSPRLTRARDEWQGVGAPYETARARAAARRSPIGRSGDEHGATIELEGALATFERLGARPDAARIKELLGRIETRRTFLFTDIVDSTRLLDTLGDEKWRRLLARHDELVREAIAESGGEVVKQTGDGFFASFESPRAAVEAAIAIQRALAAEIVAPDVRIGAHAGGAFRTGAESSDYGGQGVHVASRIGAAAAAGEILVSAETLDGVGSRVPSLRTAARVAEGRRGAGRGRLGRLALRRRSQPQAAAGGRGSAASRGRGRSAARR